VPIEPLGRWKIYTCYSGSHEEMLQKWFVGTMQDDFEVVARRLDQDCPAAEYMSAGWTDTVVQKIPLILEAIDAHEENGFFLFSDVDVQWFGPVQGRLRRLLAEHPDVDIFFQTDAWNNASGVGNLCTGFFVCKGNIRTRAFWTLVGECMSRLGEGDQRTSQEIIRRNVILGLKVDYLPPEFWGPGSLQTSPARWEPGMPLAPPMDILLHHANWTVGTANKVKQLEYVASVVRQRLGDRELADQPVAATIDQWQLTAGPSFLAPPSDPVPLGPSKDALFRIKQRPERLPGSLWAIATTIHAGNDKRNDNRNDESRERIAAETFRHSVRRHGLGLLVIEVAPAGTPWAWGRDDADILLRVERPEGSGPVDRAALLSSALGALPPECDKVAWLNPSAPLEDDSWLANAAALLERYEVWRFDAGGQADVPGGKYSRYRPAFKIVEFGPPHIRADLALTAPSGLNWAARRRLLETAGFADPRPRDRRRKMNTPEGPTTHTIRLSLTDSQAATGLDPQEIVAVVPTGVEVADRHIDAMARLLAACPEAGIVEPYCRVVEEETSAEMSSLQLKKKATPREAVLIAGPLPLVVRAGVIADLSSALAGVPPAELYAAFMAAAEEAGTAVLSIPLETHRSRFVSGIEQRAICNRLWLPLGRKRPADASVSNADESPPQAEESPNRPAEESWQLCGMLSDDPFVAISMFTPECPYGALSLFPDAFHEKPSLHLITMDHSLLWAASTLLPQRLAEAGKRWPQARFRLLAADETELRGLRAAGLPAMLCNLNMFTDERVFHPFRPEAASQTTDAICIAPLDLRENHHLARTIGSIGIVHHRYDGMDDVGAEVRRLLTQATFLNDADQESQGFFYPSDEQLAGWICQAATGLALSETGGSCFATAQYLLCGTPVVTVPNIGGRDHFLKAPFFVSADTTVESVASAVAELRARRLSRSEIHEATKHLFREARQAFLVDLNAAIREVFGSGHRIDDVSGLVGQVVRYRRAVDVLRPPGAPRQTAAARVRRWNSWLTRNLRRWGL
jgi:hypothetical protein